MKKNYILFLLLVSFLTGNLYSIDTVSTKYFPLKVGNMWTYKKYVNWPLPNGTTTWFKSIILKDTIINAHRYYFISNPHAIFVGGNNRNWFRVDSLTGNLLNYYPGVCSGSTTISVDSLSSMLTDIARVCISDSTNKRRLINISNMNLWGIPSTRLVFDWTTGPATILRQYNKYFGITSSLIGDIYPDRYTLMGCIIDGVLYGDTVVYLSIKSVSTEIPKSFSLSQNYPNPFNPTTKIKFDILSNVKGQTSNVKIVVYDILGHEVTTLVNEQLKPGSYEVEFNGDNFASGVYYYTLQSVSFKETKRMVLIN